MPSGQQLFEEAILAADRRSLLSDEHFTMDGALIVAATSLKSVKPRDVDPPLNDGDGNSSLLTWVSGSVEAGRKQFNWPTSGRRTRHPATALRSA